MDRWQSHGFGRQEDKTMKRPSFCRDQMPSRWPLVCRDVPHRTMKPNPTGTIPAHPMPALRMFALRRKPEQASPAQFCGKSFAISEKNSSSCNLPSLVSRSESGNDDLSTSHSNGGLAKAIWSPGRKRRGVIYPGVPGVRKRRRRYCKAASLLAASKCPTSKFGAQPKTTTPSATNASTIRLETGTPRLPGSAGPGTT